MSDLTPKEKALLESFLGMSEGYVLDFSNRTFAQFFADTVGIDIEDEKYTAGGDSKAKRLRAFWSIEENLIVAKALAGMLERVSDNPADQPLAELKTRCRLIVDRLLGGATLIDVKALDFAPEERNFSLLAASVRDSIDAGRPEAALDRLHTFVVKFLRQVCQGRGIDTPESKSLNALAGEYVKALQKAGLIESEITERIVRNCANVLDLFNLVRNRQSLAHDNELLGRDESILVLNQVVSIVRFIQKIEKL